MKNPALRTAIVIAAIASATSAARSVASTRPRFTVLPGGTEVADRTTGLTWQRGPAPEGKSWSDAKSYCATLGKGFRLPTVKELVSIVDFTKVQPALDTAVFFSPSLDSFWTSSAVAGFSNAWLVDFKTGETDFGTVGARHQVRCVR